MIIVLVAAVILLVVLTNRRRHPVAAVPHGLVRYPADAHLAPAVAAALGRVESLRLVRHPAFVVGIVITPLMLWAATGSATERFFWRADSGMTLALAPLGWMAIIAANLGALRARRYGATELVDVTPSTGPSRTAGHLASALVTLPVTAVLLAAWVVVEYTVFDAIGRPDPLVLAQALVMVAGGVVVGVAVARYLPAVPWGVAAVIVVIMLQTLVDELQDTPARALGFLVQPSGAGEPFLELGRPGWHLLYLAGLTVLLAGVALARDGLARPAAVVIAAGAAVAAGTVFVQTRPPSAARVAAVVDYLTDPGSHQECTTGAGIRYCAYPAFSEVVPQWQAAVGGTLAQLPKSALDGRELRVVQRPPTLLGNPDCSQAHYASTLHPKVRKQLSPASVWSRDGQVHPAFAWPEQVPCGGGDVHGLFLGVQTGAWAVGLPPAPWGADVRCRADGQSRAVVALWAGAHAGPGAAAALAELADDEAARDGDRLTFPAGEGHAASWDSPPMWGVEWHRADVVAAGQLLALPDSRVSALLASQWDRFVAPGTSTNELLTAAGLTASGSLDAAASTCP